MLKLFISLPMNGLSDDEIRDNMAEAKSEAERIMGQPMELLETLFDFDEGSHPLVYLGESIKKMAEANVVYFHLGWKQARGCFVEHIAAMKYGKYIIGYGQESVTLNARDMDVLTKDGGASDG